MSERLTVQTFQVGPLENNTYLVVDEARREAVLVDPGMDSEGLAEVIRGQNLKLTAILNTHAHFDHIYNNAFFRQAFGCPLLLHEAEVPLLRDMARHAAMFGFEPQTSPDPDAFLKPDEEIPVGGGKLRCRRIRCDHSAQGRPYGRGSLWSRAAHRGSWESRSGVMKE